MLSQRQLNLHATDASGRIDIDPPELRGQLTTGSSIRSLVCDRSHQRVAVGHALRKPRSAHPRGRAECLQGNCYSGGRGTAVTQEHECLRAPHRSCSAVERQVCQLRRASVGDAVKQQDTAVRAKAYKPGSVLVQDLIE